MVVLIALKLGDFAGMYRLQDLERGDNVNFRSLKICCRILGIYMYLSVNADVFNVACV